MSEQKQPFVPPPRNSKAPPSAVEQFLESASKLSDAERAELEERGYMMPAFGDSVDVERWGYLCSHCGAVAITFVGAKFRQQDGSYSEELPPGAKLNNLPWKQPVSEKFPRQLVSRETPICPDCQAPLNFEGGSEKFLKARHVRSLDEHRRTQAANKAAIEEYRRSQRRLPVGNKVDPNQVRIPT